MENKIKDIFNLPKEVIQDRKIKSIFYEHESFNAEKKRLFDDNIESIKLIALFNDETINIESFKDEEYVYQELYVISVILKSDKNAEKITNWIHDIIPNPVILVLSLEQKIYLSGSISRINKKDKEKAITEDVYQSIWIDTDSNDENIRSVIQSLDIKKYSYINLKEFYESFIKIGLLTHMILLVGKFKYSQKYAILDLNTIISGYQAGISILQSFKEAQKKALNFGEKVALQNDILKVEKELEFITNQAKELLENI